MYKSEVFKKQVGMKRWRNERADARSLRHRPLRLLWNWVLGVVWIQQAAEHESGTEQGQIPAPGDEQRLSAPVGHICDLMSRAVCKLSSRPAVGWAPVGKGGVPGASQLRVKNV